MTSAPSTAAFESGLGSMEIAKALSEHDRQLFRALYDGPEHTLTTMEIAHAMGWSTHSPVNAHYGKLAQRLARRMKWDVPPGAPQITTVATFQGGSPDDPHTRWTMRPELVAALVSRRIVLPVRSAQPKA